MPVWVVLLVTAFVAWLVLGSVLLRLGAGWVRNALGLCIITIGLSMAWLIPEDLPWLRFLMLIPGFAVCGKTLEVCSGKLRDPEILDSAAQSFMWLVVLPRAKWSEDPQVRRDARRDGIGVFGRAVAKALAFAGMIALNSAFDLHGQQWLSSLWMMFGLYFMFSAVVDLMTVPFRVVGMTVYEVFNAPPLARSPRDFWSRRWNLWFTQMSNMLIFQPLGGAQRPLLGVSAVFVFSAVLHEYMTWVALTRPDGRMLAFFLIHGLATILTTLLGKRLGRRTLMPRWLAVLLHIAWMTVTAPLFFGPIEDAFALSTWRMW